MLAHTLHSLPPILHIMYQISLPSYSKGSRGLFVPLRLSGIFTAAAISLSIHLRQRPDRYAIRAGQNLPDKEFRYLRTVIVTAAVYWGFNSELAPILLTFQHRAGVTPYTSSYEFAECYVFVKQSLGPLHCGFFRSAPSCELTELFCRVPWQQFSRSPWYSLPAHLCRFWYGPLMHCQKLFPGAGLICFATFLGFRLPVTSSRS